MPAGSKRKFRKKARKPTVKTLTRRVNKLERQPEIKYRDLFTGVVGTSTADQTFVVNVLAQGDDFNQRVGEEVIAKKMMLTYSYVHQAATAGGLSTFRLVVFWDKQTNAGTNYAAYTGAAPTNTVLASALLDNTIIAGFWQSPFNERTKDRYVILYDKVHEINSDDVAAAKRVDVKKTFMLRDKKIRYGSSDGTIVGIPSSSLNVMYIANNATDSLSVGTRFFFDDP